VRFSEAVTFSADPASDITVTNAANGTPYTGTVSISDTTWQLANGFFVNAQLVLTVHDTITGLGGALDGDWINPTSLSASGTSVFPSGDGDAGGDFNFYFTLLSADFNHDNIIDAADYINWRRYEGTADGATHGQGDATGDGAVNGTDYNHWQWFFGYDFTQWPA
jgi:hypothetical protein